MFLAAYDADGECLWANGVRGSLGASEILINDASDIYVIGNNLGTISFPDAVNVPPGGFIATYGPDGEFQSAQRALTDGRFWHAGWIEQDEWILTGVAQEGAQLFGVDIEVGPTFSQGFVARTGTDGTVAWITTFRSSGAAEVWECATTLEGRINVAGLFTDSLFLPNDTLLGPPGIQSFFLASLASSGEVEWAVPISASTQVFTYDLKIGPDEDVYVFGRFKGALTLGNKMLYPNNTTNGFLARFDDSGECVGAWGFGRVLFGTDGSVLPTTDGLFVSCDYDSAMVLGSEVVPVIQTGAPSLFIAKFDSLSGFTGVQYLALEGNNTLHIYANPSNGLCTVELPDAITPGSDLVLSIYDVQGRMVQQAPLLIQQGTVQLDIQAQARGTYHVELQDGTKRYTGTIVFE